MQTEAQEVQTIGKDNIPTLDIYSWNIYMLPRFILKTGKIRRARLIPELLLEKDYDIIIFQEAFHIGVRRRIKRKLKCAYSYFYGPAFHTWGRIKTNSGIWIVSKIPLKELAKVKFSDCSKENCLARKAGYLLEGDWYGNSFQLIGTHLNAGGPQQIRENQMRQIRDELINPFGRDGVPQFICGDMNTHKKDSLDYLNMLDIYNAEDGPFLSLQQYTSDKSNNDFQKPFKNKRSVIDYILLRSNGCSLKQFDRYVVMLRKQWSKDQLDLADHYGVAVQVKF